MIKTAAIAPKLAAEFMSGLGLISLRLCAMAGHPGFTRIHLDDNDARAKGVRVWLRNRRETEKLVAEIFAADRRSRRSNDGGLVIEADAAEAERLIRHFAALNGYRDVLSDDQIAVVKTRTSDRISAAIDRLQRDGKLSHLNRVYKSLGPSRPPYSAFLIDQLRGLTRVDPRDVPSYLGNLV